ncbi:MAG: class D sortase [Clostridiales bacterium]|jgi:sortase A|nr:class D sortase [Clostridiales bacterium]
MKRRGKKKLGVVNLILSPILYFSVAAGVTTAVAMPLAKPLMSSVELVVMNEPPQFDWVPRDSYAEVAVEELPATNDLIEPAPLDIPAHGERYGQLTITTAGIDAPMFFGDTKRELSQGVGTYLGAGIPGEGRTILVSAHNNMDFHTLGEVKIGDEVLVNTTYGRYVYKIVNTRVTTNVDTTAYDFARKDENLIMYTCYPFDMLGLTPDRYFVYADYVSGPQLDLAF